MAKIYLARVVRPGNQKYHGPDENNGKVPTNVASIYSSALFGVVLVLSLSLVLVWCTTFVYIKAFVLAKCSSAVELP